ncbi:hypothetical protein R3W88_034180 [Solanum pinnatisectum]|uniref:S-protein homolog n=1 Tax=Solanum pinnatisectum TaxID=50273 RepID=A0AAV9JYW5_9SOLN|nr:hypothetical protein R3W88_034180 [Solanum pinnatisectum]
MNNYLILFHFVLLLAYSNTLLTVKALNYKPNDRIKAKLTINDFEKGGSGGGPSECSGKYYHDSIPVVALSTRWYSKGRRCFKNINIYTNNGKSTQAMVVDECDTTVWKNLGISKKDPQWGLMDIFWSD